MRGQMIQGLHKLTIQWEQEAPSNTSSILAAWHEATPTRPLLCSSRHWDHLLLMVRIQMVVRKIQCSFQQLLRATLGADPELCWPQDGRQKAETRTELRT